MFKNAYQSGFLSILYSIGSKPLQIWDKTGAFLRTPRAHPLPLPLMCTPFAPPAARTSHTPAGPNTPPPQCATATSSA